MRYLRAAFSPNAGLGCNRAHLRKRVTSSPKSRSFVISMQPSAFAASRTFLSGARARCCFANRYDLEPAGVKPLDREARNVLVRQKDFPPNRTWLGRKAAALIKRLGQHG